jgi:hypothetical protein
MTRNNAGVVDQLRDYFTSLAHLREFLRQLQGQTVHSCLPQEERTGNVADKLSSRGMLSGGQGYYGFSKPEASSAQRSI